MPKKGPVLMVVNHPTAFTDPVLMCANFRRPIYSILKGNMFSSPLLKWALDGSKCIPIFRVRDGAGFSGLRQNVEMMEIVNNHFVDGHIVQIMAEGVRKFEKRLRPFQKGMARMAFNYYKKTKKDDLVILPAPISYTNADEFRSSCFTLLSEPIYLKDYIELFKENERKALNKLTKDVENQMRSNMVHIENPEDDELVDSLLMMDINERIINPLRLRETSIEPLKDQIALTQNINAMKVDNKSNLKKIMANYIQKLSASKINDHGIARPEFYNFFNFLVLILGWIPAKVGYLFNCLPLLAGKKFADVKTDNIESHASLVFAVPMLIYAFYWIFWLIAALIIGNKFLYVWLVAMPILGWFFLIHKELGDRWKWAKDYLKLDKNLQNTLKESRQRIMDMVR